LNFVLCENCGNDNILQARFCYYCGSRLETTDETLPPIIVPVYPIKKPRDTIENVGFGIRFLAAIIDWVILSIISFVFIRSIYWGPSILVFWIIVAWGYFWLFTGIKGQTVGKMAAGIKVINYEGTPPGLGYAFIREIIGKFISTLAFFIGFIWIIFDDDKKGWHDYIAQTHVVIAKSGSS